jgi:hypothetical protein
MTWPNLNSGNYCSASTAEDDKAFDLSRHGMVKEITGGGYGRLYAYDGYLKILAPFE